MVPGLAVEGFADVHVRPALVEALDTFGGKVHATVVEVVADRHEGGAVLVEADLFDVLSSAGCKAMFSIHVFPLIAIVQSGLLTLLDGGIGDISTVTGVTIILEVTRNSHTISLELRQSGVAKVQRKRLPASPTVVCNKCQLS